MSETDDQAKPLAPEVHRLHIRYQPPDSSAAAEIPTTHHSCAIKCCGCSTAILLIAATVILVLMFTVFRIKDPVLNMDSVTLHGLDLLNGSITQQSGRQNITLEADVEIKNPNAASFRFSNTTSYVYCGGSLVGKGWAPPGEAGARRTVGLKMKIDLTVEGLKRGLRGGMVTISSSTRIKGRVKISNVVKRHMDVRLECVMNVNVSSHGIQGLNCSKK